MGPRYDNRSWGQCDDWGRRKYGHRPCRPRTSAREPRSAPNRPVQGCSDESGDCYAGQGIHSYLFSKTTSTPDLEGRGAVRRATEADGEAPIILVARSTRRVYDFGRQS